LSHSTAAPLEIEIGRPDTVKTVRPLKSVADELVEKVIYSSVATALGVAKLLGEVDCDQVAGGHNIQGSFGTTMAS